MPNATSLLLWTTLALTPAPGLWAQAVKLTAMPPREQASFGFSIAVEGAYALVGAPAEETSRGAVYVFFRDPVAGWTQQARLTHDDRAAGDAFGTAVALSGPTLLVGAPGGGDEGGQNAGAAYVFFRDPVAGWRQQARLTASDPALEDRFGYAVALSGIYAVVGAPYDDDGDIDAGSAYAFAFDGRRWTQEHKLRTLSARGGDTFGAALALHGETALVGAPNADEPRGVDAGLAYVFVRSGTAWLLRAVLMAGNAAPANRFGAAVALAPRPRSSLKRALVGAPEAGATDVGTAYLFVEQDLLWAQTQQLTPGVTAGGDHVGAAVALHGDYALLGAPGTDAGQPNTGAAHLFVNDALLGWRQRATLTPPASQQNACFACSVTLNGDHLLVGASQEDETLRDAGAAYVFDRSALFTDTEAFPELSAPVEPPANYPNPFRHATTITFTIPPTIARRVPVRLTLYDVLGRDVAVLIDRPLAPGRHEVPWNAQNLPGGVYVYTLQIDDQTWTRPMLRLR